MGRRWLTPEDGDALVFASLKAIPRQLGASKLDFNFASRIAADQLLLGDGHALFESDG